MLCHGATITTLSLIVAELVTCVKAGYEVVLGGSKQSVTTTQGRDCPVYAAPGEMTASRTLLMPFTVRNPPASLQFGAAGLVQAGSPRIVGRMVL